MTTIGLLHPGEMGAAIGDALRQAGHEVLWVSAGRSAASVERAVGLVDVGSLDGLVERAEVILSVCPPHVAAEVAASVAGADALFVDANAIAPGTTRAIARDSKSFVDGGIVGPPPRKAGTTRLYLSGARAAEVAQLFEGTPVDARVVSDEIGDASALKMTYAAWTKGTAALLLAIRAVADVEGVAEPLLEEWRLSLPDLPDAVERASRSAAAKGWRWVGEMEEIAATFAAAGQPDGFHRAAAEVYRSGT